MPALDRPLTYRNHWCQWSNPCTCCNPQAAPHNLHLCSEMKRKYVYERDSLVTGSRKLKGSSTPTICIGAVLRKIELFQDWKAWTPTHVCTQKMHPITDQVTGKRCMLTSSFVHNSNEPYICSTLYLWKNKASPSNNSRPSFQQHWIFGKSTPSGCHQAAACRPGTHQSWARSYGHFFQLLGKLLRHLLKQRVGLLAGHCLLAY